MALGALRMYAVKVNG